MYALLRTPGTTEGPKMSDVYPIHVRISDFRLIYIIQLLQHCSKYMELLHKLLLTMRWHLRVDDLSLHLHTDSDVSMNKIKQQFVKYACYARISTCTITIWLFLFCTNANKSY